MIRISTSLLLLLLLCVCLGCLSEDDSEVADKLPELTKVDIAVDLLVIGELKDSGTFEELLRSKWSVPDEEIEAHGLAIGDNNQVQIKYVTAEDVIQGNAAAALESADVIVYPPMMMGQLLGDDRLSPLDLSQFSDGLKSPDILVPQRRELVQYGGKSWAVSLGSPSLALIYRADVFEQLELQPPQTWKQYERLCQQLDDAGELRGESGDPLPTATLEPWAGPWAGHMLMARAASAMRLRGRVANEFRLGSIDPLIGSSPYVRCLQNMQSVLGGRDVQSMELTPSACLQSIAAGQAAMAVCWPVAGLELDEVSPALRIAPLPQMDETYDVSRERWMKKDPGQEPITYLGHTGWMVSISKECAEINEAELFIAWLASPQIEKVLWSTQPDCSVSRMSQVADPYIWCDEKMPRQVIEDYVQLVAEDSELALVSYALRIPRADTYMNALANAVRNGVQPGADAAECLADAARDWNDISKDVGLTKQSVMYAESLGL